ncbi:MAG: presqualene diphosphate synthase HpnD [Gammaproteobacteria bacterium]|nr:presqualene diphosphate synthase HpnD [Gammaproteobacteria bacterium]
MTPNDYCQNRASKSGSSFYYSFLFLPAKQRQAIIALYAFCREVDDVVDEYTDENLARIKLAWWREEVARTFQGEPQHPVGKALLEATDNFNLPQEYFAEIIDGMEMDLNDTRYATFKELALYCHRVAGVVGLMAAEIFGYEDRRTLDYAQSLGMAFQLTNILRDVREDCDRGRLYLPLEDLQRFNVSTEQIASYTTTDNIRALLAFEAQRAHDYYQKAFDELPACDRYRQLSGLIMAAIYKTTLQEIENDHFNVLQHRIRLTPLRKLWIAWKTARHEKKAHKQIQRRTKAADSI